MHIWFLVSSSGWCISAAASESTDSFASPPHGRYAERWPNAAGCEGISLRCPARLGQAGEPILGALYPAARRPASVLAAPLRVPASTFGIDVPAGPATPTADSAAIGGRRDRATIPAADRSARRHAAEAVLRPPRNRLPLRRADRPRRVAGATVLLQATLDSAFPDGTTQRGFAPIRSIRNRRPLQFSFLHWLARGTAPTVRQRAGHGVDRCGAVAQA